MPGLASRSLTGGSLPLSSKIFHQMVVGRMGSRRTSCALVTSQSLAISPTARSGCGERSKPSPHSSPPVMRRILEKGTPTAKNREALPRHCWTPTSICGGGSTWRWLPKWCCPHVEDNTLEGFFGFFGFSGWFREEKQGNQGGDWPNP